MEELFNGIILPDKTRVKFSKPVQKIQVVDIKIKNHPAFNKKGSKQVISTELIKENEYIGSYGGEIKFFDGDATKDRLNWNPYQLTPDDEDDYYVDGETVGNELKYINDPKDVGSKGPNAKFWQSNKPLRGFYTCEIKALRDIQPGEEILVSYGDKYWRSLQEWYERKNPLLCPNCDYRTNKQYILNKHIYVESNTENYHNCTYCDKKYKQRHDLVKHLNTHTKTILYKCNKCEYESFSINAFNDHKNTQHSGVKLKCLECGLVVKYSRDLKDHIMVVHEHKEPYKCAPCNFNFGSGRALKQHMKNIHKKKRSLALEEEQDKEDLSSLESSTKEHRISEGEDD